MDNLRLNIWCPVLLGVALVLHCGCEKSVPTPAASPWESKAKEEIVKLTPRCAAKLREFMQQNVGGRMIFISVSVQPNCKGFLYEMDYRDLSGGEVFRLSSSEGITLAIDFGDVDFLRGTTLDYLADPGGFKFDNPREDISLLSEYREMKAKEERQLAEEKAKVSTIVPKQSVADLLTSRRQQAYDDLQLWWKFHQPEAASSFAAKVGRVDRYKQANGEWITVVFTGDDEKQNGGVDLINADGRQTLIFHGMNYLDEDDQFIDVNGDNLPEIVSAMAMGGKSEDDLNKIVTDATSLDIIPITSEQIPLLRIVFDVRPFKAEPTWRWRLVDNPAGSRDVVLDQQVMDDWTERARFVWSAEKSKFEGPSGSKQDGFIASPGDIESKQIEQFLKKAKIIAGD